MQQRLREQPASPDSNNQPVGQRQDGLTRTRGAARSFITMSRCCVRAVYEDQLKHCANWWSRMVVVVRACFAQSAITVYQTYLWFRTRPLVGRLLRSGNAA
ncbi:hypothetical protein MTO96_032416 [Rhipicephalus appendiculatus]